MDLKEFRNLRRPTEAWDGFSIPLKTPERHRSPWSFVAAAAALLLVLFVPWPFPSDSKPLTQEPYAPVVIASRAVAVSESSQWTPQGEITWVDVYLEEDHAL